MAIVCPHSLLGRPICLRKGRQGTFLDEKRFVRKASCSISNTCNNNQVLNNPKNLIPDPERFVRAHFRFLLKQLGPGVCWQLVQQSFTWILHMEPLLFFFYALMLNNFGLLRDCFLIKTGVQGFLRERSQFLFYFLATNAHEAHAKRVQESIIVHCDKIVLTVKVFSTQTKHVYIAMFWHNARNTVWHRNFAPCCRLANTQIVQKNASMLLENWDQHVMGFICFSPKFMAGHGGIMVYHEFMVFLVGFYRLFIFWFVWEFVGNMLTPGTTSYMIQTR